MVRITINLGRRRKIPFRRRRILRRSSRRSLRRMKKIRRRGIRIII